MARKAALSLDGLSALGAEKLAALILEETEVNAAFTKRVKAALAGVQGPDAVVRLIDRRLAALNRARGFVDWDKARDFAADLGATVDTIAGELGQHHPTQAIQLLLRFIDTHVTVFDRADDSDGRIQEVYWHAAELASDFVQNLPIDQRDWLPDRLLASLAIDEHGLTDRVCIAVAPLLPAPVLDIWDEHLRSIETPENAVTDIRQAIADARGDVDGYLVLESHKPGWRQNPMAAAERLRAAGRLDEALAWVRRPRKGGLGFATATDIADGRIHRVHDLEKVRLEARILEEMQDRPAAQKLRWAAFETSLSADLLREYLRKLDDFIEHEEQERAFAVVAATKNVYTALDFFIDWPKLDLAAKLVIDKRDIWDGRLYDVLPGAAAALAYDFPVSATILYRALLDDILTRARSKAYGHGARYLARLTELGDHVADAALVETHDAYFARLKQRHGRKAAFWDLTGKRK